ncbi:hypothetical protein [Salinarchaeum laminariae]|uniref:hypothetical protein n=1 Tax=Salinarchaeum laminariae TaxID=869888 RepID=UPI0020C0D0A0|nr:hypothetical protein [Salinarchaeum laminariae]
MSPRIRDRQRVEESETGSRNTDPGRSGGKTTGRERVEKGGWRKEGGERKMRRKEDEKRGGAEERRREERRVSGRNGEKRVPNGRRAAGERGHRPFHLATTHLSGPSHLRLD